MLSFLSSLKSAPPGVSVPLPQATGSFAPMWSWASGNGVFLEMQILRLCPRPPEHRALGWGPGMCIYPSFPGILLRTSAYLSCDFCFPIHVRDVGPSRPALVRISGAGMGHGRSPSFLRGWGKTVVSKLASKDLAPCFLGSPNIHFGSYWHPVGPTHVNYWSYLHGGPCGLSQGTSWTQPREGTEISDPERIKSQQVSEWILGTHRRGNISLKIKIFLT